MTTEERLNRIEHFTAAEAEQRRKDREESRQLWRETQRHLDDLSTTIRTMAVEFREADHRLAERIEQLAQESREADARLGARIAEADARLGARIDALVSGMGEFMAKAQPHPKE